MATSINAGLMEGVDGRVLGHVDLEERDHRAHGTADDPVHGFEHAILPLSDR